jgi:hypothetical protein
MPGMNPKSVRRMLMTKSLPQPFSRKTPSGGRIIAPMNLQMSEPVSGILTEDEILLLASKGFKQRTKSTEMNAVYCCSIN